MVAARVIINARSRTARAQHDPTRILLGAKCSVHETLKLTFFGRFNLGVPVCHRLCYKFSVYEEVSVTSLQYMTKYAKEVTHARYTRERQEGGEVAHSACAFRGTSYLSYTRVHTKPRSDRTDFSSALGFSILGK